MLELALCLKRTRMTVSDWLTIFVLWVAIFALYSSEERILICKKLGRLLQALVVCGFLLILGVIKSEEIRLRFPFFNSFQVAGGFDPPNVALVSFIILFLLLYWVFRFKLGRIASNPLIGHYQQLMKIDFSLFYKLFLKYEPNGTNKKYFSRYREILFDPVYLHAAPHNAYYYADFLPLVTEHEFARYFTTLAANSDSIYYQELKRCNKFKRVEKNALLLYTLLHARPALFMEIGGLGILKDWSIAHLEEQRSFGQSSIYSQRVDLQLNKFSDQLPLYLNLSFINLLYTEAIFQGKDLNTMCPVHYPIVSLHSQLIKKIFDNISVSRGAEDLAHPTKYHFLIDVIFDHLSNWTRYFNLSENFRAASSFLETLPTSLGFCLRSLDVGCRSNLIAESTQNELYYTALFSLYFQEDLNPLLRQTLEKYCLALMEPNTLPRILTYSLNEAYALSYGDFFVRERIALRLPRMEEYNIVIALHDLLAQAGQLL